ncbi:unnamed protein product [Sphenostylis stenocarpa]|uniref:Uncharacterized protein n=1 Tax=Sphenostylis stenocarpa TaxID=92480 RepID=A0AA86T365_9FABA|nr:unnamed protein product [Sphenostylis stenocarpa]
MENTVFDADEFSITALIGSGIEARLAIPNKQLAEINDCVHVLQCVRKNVTFYNFNREPNIGYVAVGSEPFFKSDNNLFLTATLPALRNIQHVLNNVGLADCIEATVPLNAYVYELLLNVAPSVKLIVNWFVSILKEIVRFWSMVCIYCADSLGDKSVLPAACSDKILGLGISPREYVKIADVANC